MSTAFDNLHEIVVARIALGRVISPGELHIKLKRLGFSLDFAVYVLSRPPPVPAFQTDSVCTIVQFLDGEEVDAQSASDTLELSYLVATQDAAFVPEYLDAVGRVHDAVGGRLLTLDDAPLTMESLERHVESCISDLLDEWGMEPGSEELRIFIASTYPR